MESASHMDRDTLRDEGGKKSSGLDLKGISSMGRQITAQWS